MAEAMHVQRTVRALAFALAAAAAVPSVVAASPLDDAAPSPARQRELLHLLQQDCGSCHGLTLKGGLGPALTPDAVRDRPAESMVATIVSGRPGTAMPPWQRFLSEREARWLVERLQSGQTNVSR